MYPVMQPPHPIAEPDNPAVMAAPGAGVVEKESLTSLWVWVGFFIAYLGFAWLQDQKLAETLKMGNIKANLHNILVTCMAVIIGLNFFKILFGKMRESNIAILANIGNAVYPVVSNL